MTLTKLTNSEQFLDENKSKFVVLLFDAEFTEPKDIVNNAADLLEKFANLNAASNVVVASVDAEQDSNLTTKFAIVSVPIVVCITNNGKCVKKVDTLEPAKLEVILQQELNKNIGLSVKDEEGNLDPKEKFKDYLKKLINVAPVMIFMKGHPSAPRCGFSKQLVEILTKNEIEYESFDILEHEDVRQGLKEFSDWPTYPQIYVKGEFIGGLDILKQMEETGELKSTLKV